MKILIIIARLGVGGAERLVVDDINELIRRGIEVRLVTFQPEKKDSTLAPQCHILPEHWQCIPFTGFLNIRAWFAFVSFVRTYQPNAIISHLWFANTVSRFSYIWCRARRISFEHNVAEVKTAKMQFIDRLLQGCGIVVAVSQTVRDSLAKAGLHPRRIIVLQNAINLSHYALKGLEPEEFTYLFVGRLIPQKGVDILLAAFANLTRGVLVVVGEGVERKGLEEMAKVLGIEKRVHFLGIRYDIPELLASVSCFVLPSRYEGLPMVLIEASAAGKAIIISDFEAGVEIIKHNENGLVFSREDVFALTKAMQLVQEDELLRKRLMAGAARIAGRFSIECHVDTLLSLLS